MSAALEEKSEMIFQALRATWRAQDESGAVLDAERLRGILRGGCAAFLLGDFEPIGDGVSLGIAFLTLARGALLAGGLERIIAEGAKGQA